MKYTIIVMPKFITYRLIQTMFDRDDKELMETCLSFYFYSSFHIAVKDIVHSLFIVAANHL